uniref:Polypeptide N-acetylgalactosaminyltransferase n=1 Tax=Gouania willdenowi TaxID=441366 RepID=A0A8C5DAV1_GOUWI
MRSRTTAVHRRRRMIYLWILTGFAVATLALLNIYNREIDSTPQKPDPDPLMSLRPSDRITDHSDLELLVESRDPALELGVESPSLKSLQEEHFLIVAPTKRSFNDTLQPRARKDASVPGPDPTRGEKEKVDRLVSFKRDMDHVAVQKYGFNEVVSEKTSLHRRLPEARHPECFGEKYSESLPSASVIICFHDEAWSTLLRTVHSVLETAPRTHLKEILLVDDLSQHGHLKTVLSEYVSHLDGVHLIRSTRRLGVGRCRSLGAARAAGEVLVFMDSHCELVSPIMDFIDWQSFHYNATQWPVWGVFDWRLDFHWESYPQQQDEMAAEPLQSPAIGGEVLAINKHFFQRVGAYDTGMLLWGAEHVELSIRVWSCGGSIEVVPCSRVAHLTRHHVSHDFPEQDLLQRNKVRIAVTWMDAYRKTFYRRDTLSERPNVAERLRLKKSLGCRNFHWFLTTVYPQLHVPQDRPGLSGELYSVGTGGCVDYAHGGAMPMAVKPCSGTGSQLNSDGEIRWGPTASFCMGTKAEKAVLSPCPTHSPSPSSLQWKFVRASSKDSNVSARVGVNYNCNCVIDNKLQLWQSYNCNCNFKNLLLL